MALALEDRAKADDIMIGDTPKAVKRRGKVKNVQTAGRLWKHSTLADAEGLITRDLFTFTLVRNPWDRMVNYYHWPKTQTFDHPAVILAQSKGFSGFLNAPLTQATFRKTPDAAYMTDGAGDVHSDLYIRPEHLAEDTAPLRDHLGFDLDMKIANASARPCDWRGFYTESDAELLGELCAQDVKIHRYTFDPA